MHTFSFFRVPNNVGQYSLSDAACNIPSAPGMTRGQLYTLASSQATLVNTFQTGVVCICFLPGKIRNTFHNKLHNSSTDALIHILSLPNTFTLYIFSRLYYAIRQTSLANAHTPLYTVLRIKKR